MKISSTLLTAACFACLLASCGTTSVSVATNRDPAASFAKYKTYAVAPPKSGQTMSPGSEAALRETLTTELGKRGITEAPRGRASLIVAPHVFIQGKISVQQYTDWGYMGAGGWPSGYGYYGMWAGAPMTYTDVNQYDEGTLILDFVDARTKKLVFRGVGKAVVSGSQANAEKVREAIAKIVAEYPQS